MVFLIKQHICEPVHFAGSQHEVMKAASALKGASTKGRAPLMCVYFTGLGFRQSVRDLCATQN